MEVRGLTGLMDWWRAALQKSGASAALTGLVRELRRSRQLGTARSLASAALDADPGCYEALLLVEGLTPTRKRQPLISRYAAFLEHAPFHRASPSVREKLIDGYVEQGRYDEAMDHVRSLTRMTVIAAPSEEILRACRVAAAADEPFETTRRLRQLDQVPEGLPELSVEIAEEIDVALDDLFVAAE